MSISVLLEPKAGGYRASTTSPFPLSCEGTSEAEAMDAFRNALDAKLRGGAKVVTVETSWIDRLEQTSDAVGNHPLFEEYLKILEVNRQKAREREGIV
jgi:hypothetical protein